MVFRIAILIGLYLLLKYGLFAVGVLAYYVSEGFKAIARLSSGSRSCPDCLYKSSLRSHSVS
jgi:hypothetical protein